MKYIGRDQQVQTSLAEIPTEFGSPQISVMDADQSGTLDSQKIIVAKGLESRDLMDLVVDRGARHIVQMPNLDFSRQMTFCAHIMTCAEKFFENPRYHLVELGDRSILSAPKGVFHYPMSIYGQKDSMLNAVRMDLATIPKANRILDSAGLVADEMIMNIAKDAPLYFARTFPGLSSAGRSSSFTMAYDENRLLLWTEDDYGSLSVDKMLNRLRECYASEHINPLMREGEGAGLGCRIIFDTSVSMSVFVRPGKKTVFCAVLPLGLSNRQREGLPKNLHIVALTL